MQIDAAGTFAGNFQYYHGLAPAASDSAAENGASGGRVRAPAARCQQIQSGTSRWLIRLDAGLNPDITVAV
jgi:hypothetical protein